MQEWKRDHRADWLDESMTPDIKCNVKVGLYYVWLKLKNVSVYCFNPLLVE